MARTKKLATAKAAPNPGPIEKPKGHCSIKGVAQEWDGIIELRDRVREGGPIWILGAYTNSSTSTSV